MSQSHLDRPGSFGAVHSRKRPHCDPADVVNDTSISTEEKRALLADWASDRRAVLDHPALRRLDTGEIVDIDTVLDALKRLDELELAGSWPPLHKRKANGQRAGWTFRRDDDDDEPPPCPSAAKPWKPRPLLDATAGLIAA